jgi:hypothetical protein
MMGLDRRFFWGLFLAWTPWIPILATLALAFRGVSNTKATGIAVLAGGFTEVLVLWGIVAILVGQVAAIILLSKTFSSGHWPRNLFSVISICLSGFMLILVGFLVWLSWFHLHRG